ncbi:MAG: ABC transporter ATP-binding protein [Acidobacteriota bacterium]
MSAPHRGLIVDGVSHRFGDIVAADDVRLEVRPGEVHCLLGPSGSGNSTLLRLVAGLEHLRQGTITLDGQTVADPSRHTPPEARAIGFVFQDYALFPHLDARRNVAFGMKTGSSRDKLERAESWLRRVDLQTHADAMPHTLSGGQQQRVALARALAREPAIMLLDEPFSGLDRQLRDDVRDQTLDLLRETGVATLMITHDPEEALHAGDHISIIRTGRILQTGTPDEVYRRSISRQVASVFGAVNALPSAAADGKAPSPWGDLDARSADGRRLSGPVDVLIRPSHLALDRADDDGAADDGAARGRIDRVTVNGALATVTVSVDGHTLTVHDLARRGWASGDAVDIRIVGRAAHVARARVESTE